MYFYKENKQNFDKEYWIGLLENELTFLKNIIKKINPINEAVVLRRFVKKIMEKYIKKNIKKIEIKNYSPDLKILESYENSVNKNYVYRKGFGKDIQSSINKKIKDLKLEVSNKKDLNLCKTKLKPKLNFLDESGKATELMKFMFKIKSLCNQIIHSENILKQNVLQNEENTINENIQSENDIIEIKENNNDMKTISITKIVKFIANGKKVNSSLEKLMKLRKEMKIRVKSLKETIKAVNDYQIHGHINHKESIQDLKENITRELSSLVLKNYDLDLSDKKIKCLALQCSRNVVNLNDIEIDYDMNTYEGEENDLEYFNGLRRQMNVKDKIKFNITFAYNLAIINYIKSIDILLDELNKIDLINNSIQDLNNYFKDELNKVIQEGQNSDKIIKLINRDEIFIDIEKEEFIAILENEFKDENIDILEPEINNFYFFIYLLQQVLYDEKSYKSAVDINEDYIYI